MYDYFSSLGTLFGVSLPDTMPLELNAIALMVDVILATSKVLNSSPTVW
ncbi:MAG: hypothetical protein JWR09_5657 [Mucilaginibacter sp.]|nr:hypothetical protein [Mucilaginibacter sp.]